MTKLYLHNATPSNPPTTGEKSTALPAGTFQDGSSFAKALRSYKGSAAANRGQNALNQTTHQDCFLLRNTSEALAAQTFGSGTWTIGWGSKEASANANAFLVISLYVWRPSNSSVVGYIYDSDTALGAEWTTNANPDWQTATFAGSNVTCQKDDVLVLEIWAHQATQAVLGQPSFSFYYAGQEEFGGSANNIASYISTATNIIFVDLQLQSFFFGRGR